MSLVTVAIPTFNRIGMLGEALTSVFEQTYHDFEILIGDNASTDGTEAYLASLMASDPRVKVLKHASNIGPARNWRATLCQPATRYVALLEDDNLWEPDHLERAVAALEAEPRASFYGARSVSFGLGPTLTYGLYWLGAADRVSYVSASEAAPKMLKHFVVCASSVVARRERLDEIMSWGGPGWAFIDFFWFGQLALNGGFVYDPALGARYRWHDSNDSHSLAGQRARNSAEMREEIRRLAKQGLDRGLLRPEALIDEVMTWTAAEAANLVVALSAPEAEPELRAAAREIFDRRRMEFVRGASRHAKLAATVAPFWLRFADRFDRWICGWSEDLPRR